MRSTETNQEGPGACGSCLHGAGPCGLREKNMTVCAAHILADGSSLRRAAEASLARAVEGDRELAETISYARALHQSIHGDAVGRL